MKESITLCYKTGSAEHLYQPGIEPSGGGYAVTVAHGRRGMDLQTETKTPVPLSYALAQRIYGGLVARKTAAGYVPGPPASAVADPLPVGSALPLRPIRPQPVEPGRAARLLTDPDWGMQELFAGQRLLLRKTPERIDGVTRTGRVTAVPDSLKMAAEKTQFNWVMDGVLVGDIFLAFDLPQLDFMNFRSLTYRMRLAGLRVLLVPPDPHLTIAETVIERAAKAAFAQRLREQGKAGIVLKKLSGAYPCGCPAGADRWLQCAFTTAWPAPASQP